jgi:hypothetical protein
MVGTSDRVEALEREARETRLRLDDHSRYFALILINNIIWLAVVGLLCLGNAVSVNIP